MIIRSRLESSRYYQSKQSQFPILRNELPAIFESGDESLIYILYGSSKLKGYFYATHYVYSVDTSSFSITEEQDASASFWREYSKILNATASTFTNQKYENFIVDSSTEKDNHEYILLTKSINKVFEESKDITFEDGFENLLTIKINEAILAFGTTAIKAIDSILSNEKDKLNAKNEALKMIGRINDPSTHIERKTLLLKYLFSENIILKDGAIIGLSYLDDPSVISMLQYAISRESNATLKYDLQQLLEQLMETENELVSKKNS